MSIEQALHDSLKFIRKPYWMETVTLELFPHITYAVLHDHTGTTHRLPLFSCEDGLNDWVQSEPPPIRTVSIGTKLGQITNKV